jgi:hypothetical protein
MATPPPRQAISIDNALAANETLGQLGKRLRASQACFELIASLLPAALHAQLRPGPIDDDTWTLLAPSSAVSAKLRQLVPALEMRLIEAGLPKRIIRVRILTGS